MSGKPTRKLNLHGELRQCFRSNGMAKAKFATRDDAVKAIARRNLPKRVQPYECELHGWHLGKAKLSPSKAAKNRRRPRPK